MPTYEYRCDACAHTFEIEQRITADRLEKCPECKKKKLVRLVGAGNFILKGGGWYADLYSSQPKKKPETTSGESKSETKSEKSESSGSSTDAQKSESKPDAKSESKAPPKKTESKKAE